MSALVLASLARELEGLDPIGIGFDFLLEIRGGCNEIRVVTFPLQLLTRNSIIQYPTGVNDIHQTRIGLKRNLTSIRLYMADGGLDLGSRCCLASTANPRDVVHPSSHRHPIHIGNHRCRIRVMDQCEGFDCILDVQDVQAGTCSDICHIVPFPQGILNHQRGVSGRATSAASGPNDRREAHRTEIHPPIAAAPDPTTYTPAGGSRHSRHRALPTIASLVLQALFPCCTSSTCALNKTFTVTAAAGGLPCSLTA